MGGKYLMDISSMIILGIILLLVSCGCAAKVADHYNKPRTAVATKVNNSLMGTARHFLNLSARAQRDRGILETLTGIDVAQQSWCAVFVNGILRLNNLKGTGSAMARSFLTYGIDAMHDPEIGDIVVLKRGNSRTLGHVGLLARVYTKGDEVIWLLGGNQDHKVCIKQYPSSRIIAIRTVVK